MGDSIDYCPFDLEPSWREILKEEWKKPYILRLASFLAQERFNSASVYPPEELIFNAFYKTPYDKVRVVIIGQDPYHGKGQAHGLSFSVPRGVPLPPSLQNIFKELHADLGIEIPSHGCLMHWAEQGVMLLNASLTVREGDPMSHHKQGWEIFTDSVVEVLCRREDPIAFVLWGKSAQEKCRYVKPPHVRLTAAHPSPFSAHQGFFGCRHFSKINELLTKWGKPVIDWRC